MADDSRAKRWLTRRRLLIGTAAVAGGGLVIAWFSDERRRIDGDPRTLEPDAWVQVRPDGKVIVQVDKLEMGQGVMTGFVTLVAEELGVDPASITARQAPVHPAFLDPAQTTGDSKSMRTRWQKLREAGAAARQMLVLAAAEQWNVHPTQVDTPGDSTLRNRGTGERLTYADVTEAAARLDLPATIELKPRQEYRWIGRRVARPDTPGKLTGETRFGFDLELADQLVAVVVRHPAIGGRVVRFDPASVAAMPGVRHVFAISSGVAICADGFWQARRAAERLRTELSVSPLAGINMADIRDRQRAVLDTADMIQARDDGDAGRAIAAAAQVVEAEYTLPYLAHATMEPMNATVCFADGRCEVWTATQSPDMTRDVVASMTGLSRSLVHVHVLPAGGSFGRRIMNDFVIEAVEIAMRLDGPVKLLRSREDDMRHDWFHSASLHRMRAAVGADRQPVAWEHRLVVPSTGDDLVPPAMATLLPEWLPDSAHRKLSDWALAGLRKFLGPVQARDGASNMPYEFGNVRVAVQGFDAGIPPGIWRSVGNHFNAFAVESFVDELAFAAAEDPLRFRMRHLAGSPRHLAVLECLARESGWGSAAQGRFQGVAIHAAYDSVVGQIAEVSVRQGRVRVHRVVCVIDCGLAINPDVVRQQMEGGIVFGLTAALYGAIDFDDGQVRQDNFDTYRMLRMADCPRIDVHVIESGDTPAGVGEAGVPPIAPAVSNAVFAATGVRIRQLPIRI